MVQLNSIAGTVLTHSWLVLFKFYTEPKASLLEEDGVILLECIVSKYSALLSHKLLLFFFCFFYFIFFYGRWPDTD